MTDEIRTLYQDEKVRVSTKTNPEGVSLMIFDELNTRCSTVSIPTCAMGEVIHDLQDRFVANMIGDAIRDAVEDGVLAGISDLHEAARALAIGREIEG